MDNCGVSSEWETKCGGMGCAKKYINKICIKKIFIDLNI